MDDVAVGDRECVGERLEQRLLHDAFARGLAERQHAVSVEVELVVDDDVREAGRRLRRSRSIELFNKQSDRLFVADQLAELLEASMVRMRLGGIGQAENKTEGRTDMLPPVDRLVKIGRERFDILELKATAGMDARVQFRDALMDLLRQTQCEFEGVVATAHAGSVIMRCTGQSAERLRLKERRVEAKRVMRAAIHRTIIAKWLSLRPVMSSFPRRRQWPLLRFNGTACEIRPSGGRMVVEFESAPRIAVPAFLRAEHPQHLFGTQSVAFTMRLSDLAFAVGHSLGAGMHFP